MTIDDVSTRLGAVTFHAADGPRDRLAGSFRGGLRAIAIAAFTPAGATMNVSDVKFGLNTFGDVTVDAAGAPVHQAQVIRDVIEEGRLADRAGIDYFAVGEHHRADFAVSAPTSSWPALATVTDTIRLGTAVTVLSRTIRSGSSSAFRRSTPCPRARGHHSRPGFLHRVVPAVRVRPGPVRGAVLGKTRLVRGVAAGGARHLVRRAAPATGKPGGLPAHRKRHDRVGRRRRLAGVGHPRGPVQDAADARGHRRQCTPVPALRGPLPAGQRAARQRRSAHRGPFPGVRRRHR